MAFSGLAQPGSLRIHCLILTQKGGKHLRHSLDGPGCEENGTATSNAARHHQLVSRENENERQKETEIRPTNKLSFPKHLH